MYEVTVEGCFSASHRLRLYDGELEPPHGHDWTVIAVFAGEEVDRIGVLVDFVAAKDRLDTVIADLHHTDLNENPCMLGLNPSAEYVAKVIFEGIREDATLSDHLDRVTVTEAPGCTATYRPSGSR